MPLNTEDILYIVKQVSEQDGMKATVTGVTLGSCMVGGCCVVGGFAAGPIGLTLGGIAGSLMSYAHQKGTYKSVPQIIMSMTPAQRSKLAESAGRVISEINAIDVTMAIIMISKNMSVKQLLLKELTNFFKSEMGYQLMTS